MHARLHWFVCLLVYQCQRSVRLESSHQHAGLVVRLRGPRVVLARAVTCWVKWKYMLPDLEGSLLFTSSNSIVLRIQSRPCGEALVKKSLVAVSRPVADACSAGVNKSLVVSRLGHKQVAIFALRTYTSVHIQGRLLHSLSQSQVIKSLFSNHLILGNPANVTQKSPQAKNMLSAPSESGSFRVHHRGLTRLSLSSVPPLRQL
eukprot:5395397-Amphidinium_carterae.1